MKITLCTNLLGRSTWRMRTFDATQNLVSLRSDLGVNLRATNLPESGAQGSNNQHTRPINGTYQFTLTLKMSL